MSNNVKQNGFGREPVDGGVATHLGLRRTRIQLVGVVLALIALAFAVPGPAEWWSDLAATRSTSSAGSVAAVGRAVLTAAAILVWALLAWCLLIGAAVFTACRPGAAGRAGRATLIRLAPLSAVRVLAAALGVSVIVGTSACAAPLTSAAAGSDTSAGSATATAIPDAGPTSDTAGPDPTTDVTVNIDWPSATVSGEPANPSVQRTAPSEVTSGVDRGRPPAAAPDRAVHPAAATSGGASPDPRPTGAAALTVTVRPGDTLWAIAGRALSSPATDAAIDSAWRAWYATNSAVIGDNPDLIRPGQVLLPPTSKVG